MPPLSSTAVSSYTGALLIRFVTDGSNNATGWYASYTTAACQGSRTLTDNSGTIVDGSLSCDYSASLSCTWNIQPPNATSYRLTFPQFLLAADADKLVVYKNSQSSSNLIATYQSTNLPPAYIDIVGTKVILKFTTNSTLTSSGWEMNYNVMSTGIENNLSEFGASIFPNPFNNDATVSYSLNEPTNVKITVSNVLGKIIGTYEQANAQGNNNIQLSSFVNNISQGIYFANLSFNDKSKLIKIVCTK
jgi:cubilin